MWNRADTTFPAVLDLEAFLGDPRAPDNVCGFARAAEHDEQEAFPEAACARLEEWGFHHYYVPVSCGGRLGSYEQVLFLVRAVARRDLTVAIGHGKTFLGSVCVWVGGSPAQRQRLADIVLRERGQVSLGLTEREHGSDLMATSVTAEPVEGGYRLRGEKWLINNATRCRAMTVLAAVPRKRRSALSLFLVDKKSLAEGSFECTAKNRTLGIRGADISGIRFDDAVVGEDALIGRVGAGLRILLRSLYLTRTCVSGLAMGALDTGLRCVLDFALERQLYGEPVWQIPHVSRTLAECFADTLVADCVAATSARCLNLLPGHARMASALAKYYVPATCERVLDRLSSILGARFYLRAEHWHGVFQRMLRDSRLLGLFDGSSVVNLRALGMMVSSLAGLRAQQDQGGETATVGELFALGQPVPQLDPDALASSLASPLPYLEELDRMVDELGRLAETPDPITTRLALLGAQLPPALHELEQRIEAEVSADGMAARSFELIEYARRYSELTAAVCAIRLWLQQRVGADEHFASGAWLVVAVQRLVHPASVETGPEYGRIVDQVGQHLRTLFDQERLFSVVPLALPCRTV